MTKATLCRMASVATWFMRMLGDCALRCDTCCRLVADVSPAKHGVHRDLPQRPASIPGQPHSIHAGECF